MSEFKEAVLLGARMRLENKTYKEIAEATKLSKGRLYNYLYGTTLPKGFDKIFNEEEITLIKAANKHKKQFSVSS